MLASIQKHKISVLIVTTTKHKLITFKLRTKNKVNIKIKASTIIIYRVI